MIRQLKLADLEVQERYVDFIQSVHKESFKKAHRLTLEEWLLLCYRATHKVSDLWTDMPNKVKSEVVKAIARRTDYLNEEMAAFASLKKYEEIMGSSCSLDHIIERALQLLFTYEDFVPTSVDVNVMFTMILAREKLMALIEGRDVPQLHTELSSNTRTSALVECLAKCAHWPALAYHLKSGARKYNKRRRVVMESFCDTITKVRMYYMQGGHLSCVLDQTAYDLEGKDLPTKLDVVRTADDMESELEADLQEHFDGHISVEEILLSCIEACSLMGARDVCLAHYYKEEGA